MIAVEELKVLKSNKLGIYIHVPFCIKKCNYCDFCSFPNRIDEGILYTTELKKRIKAFREKNGKRTVDSVYFGGGTPTLLPVECFEKLMTALNDAFEIADDAEITVECNPASIDKSGLGAIRSLGINRLSIGLQSANNNELSLLGRIHNYDGFLKTFRDARDVGFDNISVDLMYGIPEQTCESLKKTLRSVTALSPEHISAYGLKIEGNTEFSRNYASYNFPDGDEQADFYELCCEYLANNGYQRYEISNFSKPKRESRHNLKYWELDDYVGFGVSAHSCFEGVRYGNSNDYGAFMRGEDICEDRRSVSREEIMTEYVMLGLRLQKGISLLEFKELWGLDFKDAYPCIDQFLKANFMHEREGRISFTTKGFLVSNEILSQMLDFCD